MWKHILFACLFSALPGTVVIQTLGEQASENQVSPACPLTFTVLFLEYRRRCHRNWEDRPELVKYLCAQRWVITDTVIICALHRK